MIELCELCGKVAVQWVIQENGQRLPRCREHAELFGLSAAGRCAELLEQAHADLATAETERDYWKRTAEWLAKQD